MQACRNLLRAVVAKFPVIVAEGAAIGGDLLLPTPFAQFPLRLFPDGVKNTEAEGSEDVGYEVGLTVGRDKEPGDISFTYAWEHLETDAVISAFSESDFGYVRLKYFF